MTHTDQSVTDHQPGRVGLSAVLDVVGSWAVTQYGVEHLESPQLRIPADRLMDDWEATLMASPWARKTCYAGALRAGRLLHGLIEQDAEDSVPAGAEELLADVAVMFGLSP